MGILRITMRKTISQIVSGATAPKSTRDGTDEPNGVKDRQPTAISTA